MNAILSLMVGVSLFAAGPAQAQVDVPLPSDTLDLVYFGQKAPVLFRLHATVDGQPIQERWRRHFVAYFRLLDKNKDGVLDDHELPFASKANLLLQQGGPILFFPNRSVSATPADFGKAAGDKIDPATFLRYYHANAGPFKLAASNSYGGNEQISELIFKKLDVDKDGRLSRLELEQAWRALGGFDLDDDEVVTAQEIMPAINPFQNRVLQPGGGAMMGGPANAAKLGMLPAAFVHLAGAPSRASLAELLLSHFDKNRDGRLEKTEVELPDNIFAKLDNDRSGALDAGELAGFADRAADHEWVLRLSTKNGQRPTWTLSPDAGQSNLVSLGNADIGFAGMEAPSTFQGQTVFNFIQRQFQAADKDKKGFIEMKDLQNPQFQYVKQMFSVLDLDGDGKITEKEIVRYADFQKEGYHVSVTVRVVEQGQPLFQLLDSNRDGRLSQRELRLAWKHLAARDRNKDGFLEREELPKQYQISAGRGVQANLYNPNFYAGANPPPQTRGPAWFRKMDVNGDGDLSPREFLGSRADFDRIDANHDGLIEADEAEAFARKVR